MFSATLRTFLSSTTTMPAVNALLGSQETRPVSLEAPFPELPNFTVPSLDPRVADTIVLEEGSGIPGGYADVFRGSWIPRGQSARETVAVKILRLRGNTLSADEEASRADRIQKRLAREVTVWQMLQSTRIVPLYGYIPTAPFAPDKEGPCLISPWRRKGNLKRYLLNNPQADRLALLIQAAKAVNDLHTAPSPIVHLDIKPDNFLVNDENNVELCDFGISRILSGGPTGFTTGTGAGTQAFEAPEYMLEESDYSTSLDVYSFGCCILSILSNRVPFDNLSSARLVIAVTSGTRPDPGEYMISLAPAVAERIWILMNKCWSHEPGDRPSMTEVIQELERISLLNANRTE